MQRLSAVYLRNLTDIELCRCFKDYNGGLDADSNRLLVAELVRRLERADGFTDPRAYRSKGEFIGEAVENGFGVSINERR